ncbi:cytochrome P450 [Prauserella cavernicola]|uniref:Cytochrome P450 n=1 Tax=Prauserella cavernicola TaxID=2800127 RepID=A0A934QVI1_9PSEU|nr:cytochrome P450 [Prauserella cavernicola]MBK1787126.1 cytochrome P450 [Prauserella cavernicola]
MTTDVPLDDLRGTHRRDYDPYGNVPIAEQLDELAKRRDELPVSYSARGNGCWVLTRYDDIASVLRRSNRGFVSFPNDPDGVNSSGSEDGMIPIELDGKRHRGFRAMLDPAFSPQRVASLEGDLRAWANRLIDDWIEDGRCDFGKGFALPFPGVTVMKIMGWPEEDVERLNGWVDVVMHGLPGASEDEANAARAKAHGEVRDYMFALIAERRAAPRRDDVTSAAIDAEVDGKKLSDTELFDLFLLMMLAGLDTVQSVLGQSMVHLAQHPEQWAQLLDEPGRVESAVEEFVRWATPPVPTRTVTQDSVEVGGLTLPKGERVHFPLAVANRDPAHYDNPDEVKLDRFVDSSTKPHVGFGMGPHRCVGVHLARLELRIAYEELRRRLPTFRLDPDQTPQEHLGLAWGVNNVHLVFEPGPRELS